MIEIDDKARCAITNARALLDAMLAGGWHQVCVSAKEGDYFIARLSGTPNPLLSPAVPAAQTTLLAAAPAPAKSIRSVAAPHVGTVAWLADVGAQVTKDERVAVLEVLGSEAVIVAPEAGTVLQQSAQIGDFVEYAVELVTLNV